MKEPLTVQQLIDALSAYPKDAVVAYAWDGALRGDVHHVWLTKDGRAALGHEDAYLYYDEDCPASVTAPPNDPHWHWKP
jgi:hypothetical protein